MRGRPTGVILLLAALTLAAIAVALRPDTTAETRDRATMDTVLSALLHVDLTQTDLTGEVRLSDVDPPRLRLWMVLPDTGFERLLAQLPDAQAHRSPRELSGLPGPADARIRPANPWRASYFTVESTKADLIWLYARPLENNMSEVMIFAYGPDLAQLSIVPQGGTGAR